MTEAMGKGLMGLIALAALALVALASLPAGTMPSPHALEHREAAWLVHEDTDFACRYVNDDRVMFLEYNPFTDDCPDIFGGVITTLGGAVITAFIAKGLYWLSCITRDGYRR